jgi:hypothetical protein
MYVACGFTTPLGPNPFQRTLEGRCQSQERRRLWNWQFPIGYHDESDGFVCASGGNSNRYLYQALGSNFLWMLPWAMVVTKVKMDQAHAWTFYSIMSGGALVFDFFSVGLVVLLWSWSLMRGKIKLEVVTPGCRTSRPASRIPPSLKSTRGKLILGPQTNYERRKSFLTLFFQV